MKKDRATISDEQRERQLIAEQIERAKAGGGDSESPPPVAESQGLKRDENTEKVVLSFSVAAATSAASSVPTGLKINPPKVNPLKRPNVFKTATVGAGSSSSENVDKAVNDKKRPAPMSAAERLILEEQERKRRRMERDNAV
jgi:DNA/RNA-binding protein KIN17